METVLQSLCGKYIRNRQKKYTRKFLSFKGEEDYQVED